MTEHHKEKQSTYPTRSDRFNDRAYNKRTGERNRSSKLKRLPSRWWIRGGNVENPARDFFFFFSSLFLSIGSLFLPAKTSNSFLFYPNGLPTCSSLAKHWGPSLSRTFKADCWGSETIDGYATKFTKINSDDVGTRGWRHSFMDLPLVVTNKPNLSSQPIWRAIHRNVSIFGSIFREWNHLASIYSHLGSIYIHHVKRTCYTP